MARKKNARRNAAGNARKERLKQRRNALQNACEGLLVARGWGIYDAAELAYWWVRQALKWAQRVMERYGFDYLNMTWRAA